MKKFWVSLAAAAAIMAAGTASAGGVNVGLAIGVPAPVYVAAPSAHGYHGEPVRAPHHSHSHQAVQHMQRDYPHGQHGTYIQTAPRSHARQDHSYNAHGRH